MATYYDLRKNWGGCECRVEIDGSTASAFTFVTRVGTTTAPATNAVTGQLVNYAGKAVGTYSAYNQLVTCDAENGFDNNGASNGTGNITPDGGETGASGGVFYKDGTYLVYLNGVGKINGDKIEISEYGFDCQRLDPHNLQFVIERNYTDISRDTYYVVRAVNDIGEESPPSELSELVSRQADESAVLSFLAKDGETAAAEKVVAYRIYRAAGGTSQSDFLFAGEVKGDYVGFVGGTFQDTLTDDELNEVMPKYGAVPERLDGIAGMSGGFLAAYKGKDIYFSEPYIYYCFPWKYNQSVPFDIVGMAARGNYLYVMTTGSLYAFVGNSPDTISPLAIRFDVPCVSKKSIAYVRGSVIYAGTTGLVVIANGNPQIFSDKLFTLEQYKNLHFENCIASGEYDGKYFAVFEDKALLFDLSDSELKLTTLDKNAFAVTQYSYDDGSWKNYESEFAAYNVPYGETRIKQDFSLPHLNATWKSKDFVLQRPVAFTCARARFEDLQAEIRIRLYAEGEMVFDGKAQHNVAFRLPVMRRECRWSVEVSGACDITSLELAESMSEM